MVSITFSPERFDTSSATAVFPLTRAKLVGSRKVLRTSAISRTWTTASPSTKTGRSAISRILSKRPGTLIENRPLPVSCTPAATSIFELFTVAAASAGSSP